MSFHDVDDTVETVLSLGQHSEMVVAGEVTTLDVELIDPVVRTNVSFPDLSDLGMFQLGLVVMVMLLDLLHV